tara:strand:- start:307 stop:501 length:195 start_codon:yes stop_codon:yes gene_type:complete
MLKNNNKRFPNLETAKIAAIKIANELECNVPIYMAYSDPPGYHLWNGHELLEWIKPDIEIEECY